ncbi:MAG: anthranilate synthase component I family protein [Marinilabiliales bacterium]|nr:MAG: anthranilate synthase component I family protein [Marinilabiliales bacterium]
MEKLTLKAEIREYPADTLTPVGIYMRLRDAFPGSLLLECTDYSSRQDAFSYICLNPLAGIEVTGKGISQYHGQRQSPVTPLEKGADAVDAVDNFSRSVRIEGLPGDKLFPGLFGFTSWEAVNLFDNVDIRPAGPGYPIPLLRYDLYSVVIAINHFNSTMTICELENGSSGALTGKIVSLLANRNTTTFPFETMGDETSNLDDDTYMRMVEQGRKHCARGDVFQIVLSRKYEQAYHGDEFSVYRALRSVNPSPYLFYFDYLGYRLFGSSPEAQLQVSNGTATINPIAGTIPRTGDRMSDEGLAKALLADPKENSEHSMLVDLARNDLSRHSAGVRVSSYKEVHAYSHVIHLVSTVTGELDGKSGTYRVFADTFPAGTLSGAPKHKALQLIGSIEPTARGYYGGAIGFMGLEGSLNHAIMIRSFASFAGRLVYQAGAGIVIGSDPAKELAEVNSKLSALKQALKMAEKLK